jgi:DNA-damage-inducible protein J
MKHERIEPLEEVKGRLSGSVKRSAEAVFKHYNLSTSQAISLFFHTVAESKSLSFNLTMPNQETIKAIDDVKNRVGIKKFNNAQEMLSDLHSDDIEE